MMRSLLPAALILLAGVATAQDSNSTSRAEAHAEAHSDSSKSSHTRRVVVVNGKTIVDEETVNGKPVRRKAPRARKPPQRPMDAERLLEEVERDLPPEARELLKRARQNRKNGATGSSHTRRVKVVNGKTVIDEETIDGKPVKRKAPRARRPLQGPTDAERLLEEVERDLPPEARELLDRGLEDGTTGTSRGRRLKPSNGKRLIDELTIDGLKLELPTPASLDPRQLLRELGRDLPPEARARLDRAIENDNAGATLTRRLKVVNGRKVIDEQTVGGKRVAPRDLRINMLSGLDPAQLLRELGRDLPPEARERLDRAIERKMTGRDQTRRGLKVNGQNGKKGVDEKPVEARQRSKGARRLRPVDSEGTRKLW